MKLYVFWREFRHLRFPPGVTILISSESPRCPEHFVKPTHAHLYEREKKREKKR